MVLSPLAVTASICILDSLQGGLSHFYAEILRLKLIDEQSKGPVPVLFLLDELLSGTNSHDRRVGTESFVRSLLPRGAIGLVTTHDLALAEIAEGMAGAEKYYLAYVGKEPVAYADIEKRSSDYFLHKFYVDVSKHRGGIGHQFFQYLLQQMGTAVPIRLQVNRQNYKAINFYFKQGFKIETTGDFDIGGGFFMNDFVMILSR